MSIYKPLAPGAPPEEAVNPLINFKPLPKEEDGPKYLFRYVSLPTFISMFYTKNIIFKSAVYYKDKNECTYPYHEAGSALTWSNINKGGQAFHDYHYQLKLERGRFFSSCWFGSDDPYPRETMRQFFSRDGVVLLFDRQALLQGFKSDMTIHSHQMSNLSLDAYGSVKYYLIDEFADDVLDDREVTHPAFAKRKSFELENEYRFVVDIGERLLEYNYLNKKITNQRNRLKEFDPQRRCIFASLPEDKSFNDIGLIKVIGCSDEAYGILGLLRQQSEVKFSRLLTSEWGIRKNLVRREAKFRHSDQYTIVHEYTFKQEDGDELVIEHWESVVNQSTRGSDYYLRMRPNPPPHVK